MPEISPRVQTAIAQAQQQTQATAPVKGQEITQELPAEATPSKTVEVSPERLAMARREKALRERERQLGDLEKRLKDQEAKYQTEYVPKSRIKEDPLALFKDGLITYDQMTEAILGAGNKADPTILELQRKNADLESKVSKMSETFESSQKSQIDQAKKQITADVKMFLGQNTEFEVLNSLGDEGATEAVTQLIFDTWEKEDRLMSEEEAAKTIEEHMMGEAIRLARLAKVQKALAPEATETPAAAQTPARDTKAVGQKLTTLSNAVTTSGRKLTPVERAKLAFMGKSIPE